GVWLFAARAGMPARPVTASARALACSASCLAHRLLGPARLGVQPSLFHVDERPDGRVREHAAGVADGHLNTAQALREPILRAIEAVQRVAAVEVADVRDARIAV